MILDTKVTLFASCRDVVPKAHPTLGSVLDAIRTPSERVSALIAECRAQTDKDGRSKIKAKLPAVCFGAELFHRRGDDQSGQIKAPTGILCADVDHVADLKAKRDVLISDRHVIAVFISPSGDGLKALVPIIGDFTGAFRAAANYFSGLGLALDEARKDQTGLCFASHDPSVWVANDPDACEPFRPAEQSTPIPRFHDRDGDVVSDFATSHAAQEPLMMISPDCDYQQWIEIGQAIHCQFGGSFEGLALWDSWSRHGSKYKGEKDLETHYKSFRSSGITFRTVLKYAVDAGWSRPGRPKQRVQAQRPPQTANELGELINAQITGAYSAAPFPFTMLSRSSRALLPGSVTLLCGAPGSAKSWFVLQCLHHWTTVGIPVAVLMLEEGRGWHMNRLLAQLTRNKDILDPDWVKGHGEEVHAMHSRHRSTIDAVNANLQCDGNVTVEACCQWIEAQCDAGKRIIVVDPITLADNGNMKPWDADRRLLARSKVAIEKAGASLLLVTHPRKGTGGGSKPAPPCMDDLAGGAAYTRAAACVLWMNGSMQQERALVVNQHGMISDEDVHKTVRILKARNSTGQNLSIAFSFSNLVLDELGAISQKGDQPPPVRQPPRINSAPNDSEDKFAP